MSVRKATAITMSTEPRGAQHPEFGRVVALPEVEVFTIDANVEQLDYVLATSHCCALARWSGCSLDRDPVSLPTVFILPILTMP
jgi:hypothetical protein